MAARSGIDNTPPPEIVENLQRLAMGLEEVCHVLGDKPIHVSSGNRCAALNSAIGGAANSMHMRGLAADILYPQFGSPLEVCQAIRDARIATDQIIHEFGRWCHVAFPEPGVAARGQLWIIASAAQGYQTGLNPIA